jgi:predicted AAA+ superfamily ATPase
MWETLHRWRDRTDRALFLRGARQVGKTYILQKFGSEVFTATVYLNMRDSDVRERFEYLYHNASRKSPQAGNEAMMGGIWSEIFSHFDAGFRDDGDTLIVLDEIQSSVLAYNSIRSMRRSLKSRIAVTGSYLGILASKDFWEPVGDLFTVDMTSLSYIEFLKALGVYAGYAEIRSFDLRILRPEEVAVYREVEQLYRLYMSIGGYPAVLKSWLRFRNLEDCYEVIGSIQRQLYGEVNRNITGDIGEDNWQRIMSLLAYEINSHLGNFVVTNSRRQFADWMNSGISATREQIQQVIKWLCNSHSLRTLTVVPSLKPFHPAVGNTKVYFSDIGVLNYLSNQIYGDKFRTNYAGMAAENFVYLYLASRWTPTGTGNVVSYKSPSTGDEIDFILQDNGANLHAIEVKSGKGTSPSSDSALSRGDVQQVIRVQNTFGSVDTKSIVPIFAIDKIEFLLCGKQPEFTSDLDLF